MKLLLLFFILLNSHLLANFYSLGEDGKIYFEKFDFVNSVKIKTLMEKDKPTIVIVKKTNCKFFLKWNASLNKKNKNSIRDLYKFFHIVILDDKLDDVPKELLGEMSPTFYMIDEYGVSGEINGMMSPKELMENFIF